MPELFDVIELIGDIPERGLQAGMQGTIIHLHPNSAFEVEFTDEDGQMIEELSLTSDQFIVVWRSATQKWEPIGEQVAALVARLPQTEAKEVLDFARFLSAGSTTGSRGRDNRVRRTGQNHSCTTIRFLARASHSTVSCGAIFLQKLGDKLNRLEQRVTWVHRCHTTYAAPAAC